MNTHLCLVAFCCLKYLSISDTIKSQTLVRLMVLKPLFFREAIIVGWKGQATLYARNMVIEPADFSYTGSLCRR